MEVCRRGCCVTSYLLEGVLLVGAALARYKEEEEEEEESRNKKSMCLQAQKKFQSHLFEHFVA